jgi:hypothetical protein
MTTPSCRRRFRFTFSIRTLFTIHAALGCWVGWLAWTFRTTEWPLERVPAVVISVFMCLMLGGAFLTRLVAPQDKQ